MTQYPGQPAPENSPYGPQSTPPQPQYFDRNQPSAQQYDQQSGQQYGQPGYAAPQYAITSYGANQYAPNPYPVQSVGSGTNQPGLWSLIIGIATPVVSIIPFIQVLAVLMPFAGIVLGIVGLAMEQYRGNRVLAGWGLGVNIGMLVIIPLIFVLFFAMLFPLALIGSTPS
ncbi:hypothetical protein [Gulosibacter molinativorax]|uniref:DUF4190 domain-containing protein n=1 Tax=Gulosibacter molinativorax TaxID=256821 RepID=A0ABT7C940_9MICO|nr:hypothetical protein [Gulosibacter molinativorax]MDJ1371718.1 hypothetical protein [Gulosibacter molinativorax]QUY63139.1 Hypotetical protein [Gulosibacter molinativorax]